MEFLGAIADRFAAYIDELTIGMTVTGSGNSIAAPMVERSRTVHGYLSPPYSAMARLSTLYRGAILVSTMLTNQYPGSCTKPLTESL